LIADAAFELTMKKIGIVGGVAWPSTVIYYSELCRLGEQRHLARNLPGAPSTPEIVIESLDLNKALAYLGADDDEASWSRFDAYHRLALERVERSGAEVAAIACNTAHHRFEAIVRGIRIPVISILDASAQEGARLGVKQVLILGTPVTMQSPKFREAFTNHGIQAAVPQDSEAKRMIEALIIDLQRGRIEGTTERLGRIAKASFEKQFAGRPVACLACTELPLAFESFQTVASFAHDGVSYINTTAAHINAVFDFAVG
jgi:aspartate racemase